MVDNMSGIIAGNINIPENNISKKSGETLTNISNDNNGSLIKDDNNLIGKNKINNALDDAMNGITRSNKKKISSTDLQQVTDKLNKDMNDMNLQLKFVWYKEIDQLGVRMIDIDTQKIIKSFPPEDVMKTLIKTKDWIGKFLDENV
ncbi:flagellar protein FlaG [Pectinatus sottacetonis]|uniref:flagellar protein FlaG n=1 Tax=Pectinatus sottacetonis TaxID=1002795 RepID=UPI0018C7CD60|nr:flagellar protein FlaG [Pectinatus sottacetonis]